MARVMSCFAWDEPREILDIALSERDLITLLTLLYTPGHSGSFINRDVPPEFAYSRIRAEPDALHYAYPTREGAGPAEMNPLVEAVHRTIHKVVQQHVENAAAERKLEWEELERGDPS